MKPLNTMALRSVAALKEEYEELDRLYQYCSMPKIRKTIRNMLEETQARACGVYWGYGYCNDEMPEWCKE